MLTTPAKEVRMRTLSCIAVAAWLSVPLMAQSTVYVAPVPQPGDPNYLPYQLHKLGETLQRNQVNAAHLDALRSQAEVNRAILDQLKRDELDSLLSLASLLEAAGTEEQKASLRQVIEQKLDAFIPDLLRTYPPGSTLVFGTPGFPWAPQQVAGVLRGKPVAVDLSYSDAFRILTENPDVIGLVEVEINVYQAFETVKIICHDKSGGRLWERKTILNAGGGPEQLARDMVGRLLKKVKGLQCSG